MLNYFGCHYLFSYFSFPYMLNYFGCQPATTYFLISLFPMLISFLVFSLQISLQLFSSKLPPFVSSLFSILSSLFFFFISQSTKLFFVFITNLSSALLFPNCRLFSILSSLFFFFISQSTKLFFVFVFPFPMSQQISELSSSVPKLPPLSL
jgi:hypothetical protein